MILMECRDVAATKATHTGIQEVTGGTEEAVLQTIWIAFEAIYRMQDVWLKFPCVFCCH